MLLTSHNPQIGPCLVLQDVFLAERVWKEVPLFEVRKRACCHPISSLWNLSAPLLRLLFILMLVVSVRRTSSCGHTSCYVYNVISVKMPKCWNQAAKNKYKYVILNTLGPLFVYIYIYNRQQHANHIFIHHLHISKYRGSAAKQI